MQFHEIQRRGREQHGAVSLEQIRTVTSRKQRDRLIRQGFITPIRRECTLLAGVKSAWEQRITAAQLVVRGSVISHQSAARIWGFGDADCTLLEVIVEKRRYKRRGIKVHTTDFLPKRHVCEHNGFIVTTPERTLINLAAVLKPYALERALENAIRIGVTSAERVARELEGHRGSGRHGTRRLALLLQPILLAPSDLRSWLERRTWKWLKRSGLPLPERQRRFVFNGQPRHPDFTWPEDHIIVEADGGTWHNDIISFHQDKGRDLAFNAIGFHVIRITHKTTEENLIAALRRHLASPNKRKWNNSERIASDHE